MHELAAMWKPKSLTHEQIAIAQKRIAKLSRLVGRAVAELNTTDPSAANALSLAAQDIVQRIGRGEL